MEHKLEGFAMLHAIEINNLPLAVLPQKREQNSISRLLNLILSAEVRMNKRVCERISKNIQETRQVHEEASQEQQKNKQCVELAIRKLYAASKGTSQIN
jgi:flagellar motility protein MotE (MotC chaperone)